MGEQPRPTGRPAVALFVAIGLFVVVQGIAVLLTVPDIRHGSAGPATAEVLDGLTGPAGYTQVESSPLDAARLDEVGLHGYGGLVHEGSLRRWRADDGAILTVLLVRVGDATTGNLADRLLAEQLASRAAVEQITDPIEAWQGSLRAGPGEVTAFWVYDTDVVAVVTLNHPLGVAEAGITTAMVSQLNTTLGSAGYAAPFTTNPVALIGGLATMVWAVGAVIWFLRFVVTAARTRGVPRPRDPAASIDASPEARRLRRTGRVVELLQYGSLVVTCEMYLAAPVFVRAKANGPVPGIVIGFGTVLFMIAVGVVATLLLRVAEGRHSRQPASRSGRVLAVFPMLLGIGVFALGLNALSNSAIGNVLGLNIYVRVPAAFNVALIAVTLTYFIFALVVTIGTVWVAALAFRWAALLRLPAPRSGAALPGDAALLLRSFRDDRARVGALAGGRRSLLDAWSTRATDRFEEVVAWELSDRWAVAAIAEPGGPRRLLGAARFRFADDQWQGAIWQELHQGPCIVAVLGDTPGFGWEVGALLRSGALARTVILVPPIDAPGRAYRLGLLYQALVAAGATPSPLANPESTIAMLIDANHRVTTITVDRWDEAGYRAALRAAFAALNLPVTTPAVGPAAAH